MMQPKLTTKETLWGVVAAGTVYLLSTLPIVLVSIRGLWNSPLGQSAWLRALVQTFLSPLSTYTTFSLTVVVVNSLLAGILVAGLVRAQHKRVGKAAGSGIVLSFISAGCASCGGLVLGPVLAGIGGIGLTALLPLHGYELLLISTLLLVYAARQTWHKALASPTCQV